MNASNGPTYVLPLSDAKGKISQTEAYFETSAVYVLRTEHWHRSHARLGQYLGKQGIRVAFFYPLTGIDFQMGPRQPR